MRLDLDEATQDELDTIAGPEGHGFKIVRYREERGRFNRLRELNEVPGLANSCRTTSHPAFRSVDRTPSSAVTWNLRRAAYVIRLHDGWQEWRTAGRATAQCRIRLTTR
jgi:hypothetical protein